MVSCASLDQYWGIGAVFALSLVVFAVKIWVDSRIKAGVNTAFEKKLADHKHELDILAERVRFEHQRLLQEFSLFATKKHETHAELFKLLRLAHGHCAGLFGMGKSRTFEDYNENDLARYLETLKLTEATASSIKDRWKTDKDSAIREIREFERRKQIHDARLAMTSASNHLLSNEVYFSNATIEKARKLLDLLHDFILDAEYPPRPGSKPQQSSVCTVNSAVEAVRSQIRFDLGIEAKSNSVEISKS